MKQLLHDVYFAAYDIDIIHLLSHILQKIFQEIKASV